jgi:chorismate mutase
MNAADDLAALRRALDEVDAALRAGVDHRLALARAAAGPKEHLGLPVLQPQREAEVRAAWEAHAHAAGWPPGLATRLVEALLEAGRTAQGDGDRP